MAIAASLSNYLNQHQVDYHLLKHRPAATLLDAARASTLPPAAVAHSLLLHDHLDRYWIAVIGSDRHLDLHAVEELIDCDVRICSALPCGDKSWFRDCSPGVVPPFGSPYQINTLIDEQLLQQPAVYFEDGDPTELIRIERHALHNLIRDCTVAAISARAARH